jgi:long-subunit fatty acid transport protein
MRRFVLLLALIVVVPASAQNTDIESLAGLQFNFGNPGARSLGMGGAFLGLADDATALEANPAGLTILAKPEISIEGRNYKEAQILTTSGVFPDFERTAFSNYSDRVQISFASVVYPIGNFRVGGYFHEPLRNGGGGFVVPQVNEFSGRIDKDVPSFFFPRDGGAPLSEQECEDLRLQTNDFFACSQFGLKPFITAVDIQERTWGVGGAWKIHEKFSVGATVRYQTFREEALTLRFTPDFNIDSISVQATGELGDDGEIDIKEESDVTFSAGFKWTLNDKFSVGGAYKKGASFIAPIFGSNVLTDGELIQGSDVTFHVPDVYGVGVSFRPIPTLTFNVDGVRVTYSNLVDDFVSVIADVQDVEGQLYTAEDVTEIHVGAEYFFPTKIPFAIRGGYWRDPAHSIVYNGPQDIFEGAAAALLYPEGEDQNHYSIGAGVAWPRFQIDAAYDTSDNYKVGSISVVFRR